MRLFVGVDLPQEVKDYVFSLQARIHSAPAKIKFVEKRNLHLSLKFLGEVDESIVDEIKSRLKKVKSGVVNMALGGLGVFPGYDNVRVVWVGIEPEVDFISLQQKVDAELLGLFREEQDFKGHLTLGRVKFVKKKVDFRAALSEIEIKPLGFRIGSFQLFSSELSRSGSRYAVLENYALG